ncbi:MAG: glycosyltransferase family 2 protein [Alphaproteobacteria bacterium]|jgi:cellulose synthase/poly-beta-1,6-N-acetylglucosamine synthase-like glycosyltransferase|nr:glycosyltransferase family 2 protein [Alphaproteobacteria bacterium]
MEVAVSIATFGRPAGLRRLLAGLNGLRFEGPTPDLRYVVVDNDPEGSGFAVRAVIAEMAATMNGPILYLEEPRRGISFARNRGLEACIDAEFVAFIDDDEVPEPSWLEALLHRCRDSDADAVGGPVLPRFEVAPPDWARKGRFYERSRYPDGHEIGVAYTGNALLRTAAARKAGLRFDDRLALSGGEDAHLFRRLKAAGGRIVWSNAAIVHESVPPQHLKPSWVVRRSFSIGWRFTRIDRELNPGPASLARNLYAALVRIVPGTARLLFFALGPPHRRIDALQTITAGAGRAAALLGLQTEFHKLPSTDAT